MKYMIAHGGDLRYMGKEPEVMAIPKKLEQLITDYVHLKDELNEIEYVMTLTNCPGKRRLSKKYFKKWLAHRDIMIPLENKLSAADPDTFHKWWFRTDWTIVTFAGAKK